MEKHNQELNPSLTSSGNQEAQNEQVILPTNRFLFPDYERSSSIKFNSQQLQYLERIRDQQNRYSYDTTPLVVSVGKLPYPSRTQTGVPFDDGFDSYLILPSPTTSEQDRSINYNNRSGLLDPSLFDSNSITRKQNQSTINSYLSYYSIDPDSEKNVKNPRIQESSRNENQREDTRMRDETSLEAGPSKTTITRSHPSLSSTNSTAGISPMSRKKEPWMTELKITFGESLNRSSYSDLDFKYPQVGQTFKTIENFKETCLLASWAAGHDMHVRNHYKTDLWERCVFTCRHDRSPPKGYNCPFKIVAMGDKPNRNPKQAIPTWKVIKAQLGHRNHEVFPGLYDPLGKRTYRKRTAEDNLPPPPTTTNNKNNMQPKKRGRPRSTIQVEKVTSKPRPKPPPSVAFPAPTAKITERNRPPISPPSPPVLSSDHDDHEHSDDHDLAYSPNLESNSDDSDDAHPNPGSRILPQISKLNQSAA
ncbi:hypothetical protein MJO29_008892 [Puccinia striiformis f. sp. tritici]|nr:hypothetical protein MJO29_008892 [Puccinia striiformis f. sp. tritici]